MCACSGSQAGAPGHRRRQSHSATHPGRSWGWLPALSLIAASGLVAVSISFSLVGAGLQVADWLFWIGMVLISAPITLRLAAAAPGIRERVGLLIVLGLMLQLVDLVRSPASFTTYDELLHLRTITDIVSSGRLFTSNPLLLVSPLFPGLEIVTAAVVQISGADPFTASIVVLGFVRVLFAAGLFALYREASSSERIAGLGAAIYMLNPNFTFFDSGFSYETLALPLVPILLLISALRAKREGGLLLSVVLVAVAATLTVTHHVTTLAAIAFLVMWLVVHRLVPTRRSISGAGDRRDHRPDGRRRCNLAGRGRAHRPVVPCRPDRERRDRGDPTRDDLRGSRPIPVRDWSDRAVLGAWSGPGDGCPPDLRHRAGRLAPDPQTSR